MSLAAERGRGVHAGAGSGANGHARSRGGAVRGRPGLTGGSR